MKQQLEGFDFYMNHGFNIKDGGAATLDQATPGLRAFGARVTEVDRKWEGLFAAGMNDKESAHALANRVMGTTRSKLKRPTRTVLVGHSHGCNIIQQAFQLRPLLSKFVSLVLLVNPAMRVDAEFPTGVKAVCFHSQHDKTVVSSKAIRYIPIFRHWLPKEWGPAGCYGLANPSAFRVNINLNELTGKRMEHSTVFQSPEATQTLVLEMVRHAVLAEQEEPSADPTTRFRKQALI